MKVQPPKKPADVPKITKIAGPMQQDAAKNDARIVPILDMFSVFISESGYRHPKPGSLKGLDVGTPAGAAIGNLTVDDDCRHRFDAESICPLRHRRIVHIKDNHLTRWAGIVLNQSDRIPANRASGAEYFDFAVRIHFDTPYYFYG